MNFAIIETGGKQLLVKEKDVIYIEKVDYNEGDQIIFDKVLSYNTQLGSPFLNNIKIIGKVIKQSKTKKIVVYRHNPKSTHKRKYGHRQLFTKVSIEKIEEVSNSKGVVN